MSVDYQTPEYLNSLSVVKKCRDTVSGSKAVKDGGTLYLPMINPTDKSQGNKDRYDQLRDLALYTNFVGRTAEALNGALWRKPADIEVPTPLEYMLEDCDGSGLSLAQFTKDITFDIQQAGRYGILVEGIGEKPGVVARFNAYLHESIINVRRDNGQLSLVVLKQQYQESDDGFEYVIKDEFLVLSLVDGEYTQTMYRAGEIYGEVITPKDYNGNTFDRIPFVFAGSKNNDETIDTPPLASLSEVNIAHYRNSASVERSGWIMGEPMLVIAPGDGLPAEHFSENPIIFGAASGVNVGTGGTLDIVQAQPNTLAQALQKEKVEQMLLIGARLAETNSGNETATGASIRHGAETSVLSTIANNVSSAMLQALKFAEQFMSETESDEIVFQIGTDFFAQAPDAQLLNVMLMIADRGKYLPQDDFIRFLKRYGFYDGTRTIEEIKNDASIEDPLL